MSSAGNDWNGQGRLIDIFEKKKVDRLSNNTVLGIDIGSRQSKAALLHDNQLYTVLVPTGFFMQETADELIQTLIEKSGISRSDIKYIVSTGYGRIALKYNDIPNRIVTEIACHGMGAYYLGKDIKTVIDIW